MKYLVSSLNLKILVYCFFLLFSVKAYSVECQFITEKCIQLANEGDSEAQYSLGLLYSGFQFEVKDRDYAVAYTWFKKAALNKNMKAQFSLGVMYENGIGAKQNIKTAIKWYKKAAKNKLSVAQLNLGVIYDNGVDVKKNIKTASKWYKRAAIKGIDREQYHLDALYSLGHGLSSKQYYRNAYKWYVESEVKQPNSFSLILGDFKLNGFGSDKSYDLALKSYLVAAKAGFDRASFELGVVYLILRDFEKAFSSFEIAVSQGNVVAMYNIAVILNFKDYPNRKNIDSAFKWYEKAANQGDLRSQKKLASEYVRNRNSKYSKRDGFSTIITPEKNHTLSFNWYKKAAEQGDLESQAKIASMYSQGIGVEINDKLAFKWAKNAAELGNKVAARQVSKLYRNGVGTPVNAQASQKWSKIATSYRFDRWSIKSRNKPSRPFNTIGLVRDKKVFERKKINNENRLLIDAETGDVDSQVTVGWRFLEGVIYKRDYGKAYKWLKKASNHGDRRGQFYLGKMYADGLGVPKDYVKAHELYTQAAKSDFNLARFGLVDLYKNGYGVEKDNAEAFRWFKEAYQALVNGRLREEKKSLKRISSMSRQKSIKKNNAIYFTEYALKLIDNPLGVKDYKTAFAWYEKAALREYDHGQYKLGFFYENGLGVPKNLSKALSWYKKAANQRHNLARSRLKELKID